MKTLNHITVLVVAMACNYIGFTQVYAEEKKEHSKAYPSNICMQSYPGNIQARIEAKERGYRRTLVASARPISKSYITPYYVITNLTKWRPGKTVTVAFSGGDYDLRKKISEAANEWAKHANLTFDYGHNKIQKNFREWNTSDTSYAADIRISFNYGGYWSAVGTDSNDPQIFQPNEPSMNFSQFHIELPGDWKATVLHEFGHALGLQHEHQHPDEGCDDEFRWNDDAGYVATTDNRGRYITDFDGKRPGIYTVLGGPPNNWSTDIVNHNLMQLGNSRAYDYGKFDPDSIMKYYFDEWMFVNGTSSHCYTSSWNNKLSSQDIAGVKRAYPKNRNQIVKILDRRQDILETLTSIKKLPASFDSRFNMQLLELRNAKDN